MQGCCGSTSPPSYSRMKGLRSQRTVQSCAVCTCISLHCADHPRATTCPGLRHHALIAFLHINAGVNEFAIHKLRSHCHLCLWRLTPFSSIGYLQHRLRGLPGFSLSLALANPLPTRAIINICIMVTAQAWTSLAVQGRRLMLRVRRWPGDQPFL